MDDDQILLFEENETEQNNNILENVFKENENINIDEHYNQSSNNTNRGNDNIDDEDNNNDSHNEGNNNDSQEEEENNMEELYESRVNWFSSSGRSIKTPAKYMHLQVKSVSKICKYITDYATTIGKIIENMRNKEFIKEEINCAQTYSLKKGITKFKEKGEAAVHKEMSQLHKREVFRPINLNELSPHEKKRPWTASYS